MLRHTLVLVAALLVPTLVTAQDLKPGWLQAAIDREAAAMARTPAPRDALFGVGSSLPGDSRRVSERTKLLAAVASVTLWVVATGGSGMPSGLDPENRRRVAAQFGLVDGVFSDFMFRILRW
jgi:hypothetical protein